MSFDYCNENFLADPSVKRFQKYAHHHIDSSRLAYEATPRYPMVDTFQVWRFLNRVRKRKLARAQVPGNEVYQDPHDHVRHIVVTVKILSTPTPARHYQNFMLQRKTVVLYC